VSLLARDVFGIAELVSLRNGSGDQTYNYVECLLFALVAVLGTTVWSISIVVGQLSAAGRRDLGGAALLLGYILLSYGISKVLKSQFPDLWPGRLIGTVGDMSPMGLLWTFMGYSTPYTVFAGLLEAIGGALLLWRRTVTIGALMVAAVMFNVVMLNLCYDVPVKLFSIELFIMALAIAAPRVRPLLAVALGVPRPK